MSVKAKKPQERRHGDYVYRDGRYFGNYQVYDDGRVNARQLADELRHFNEDYAALARMQQWHADWLHEQHRTLERRVSEWRRKVHSELTLILPSYDPDKFEYMVDPKTGMITPEPKPLPAPEEDPPPRPSDTETTDG